MRCRRGSREADVAPHQFLARELVGAGADRLDETEFLRAVEKAVSPKPGLSGISYSWHCELPKITPNRAEVINIVLMARGTSG